MRSLLVELPFVYRARIIAPRRRTPEVVVVFGRFPARIPVAEAEEMPVAFRVLEARKSRSAGREAARRDLAERGEDLRWDGRQLLRAHGGIAEPIGEGLLQAALNRMVGTPLSPAQWEGSGSARMAPSERAEIMDTGCRWTWDNEAEARASVLAAARRAVFCEGRFWVPCGEPVWVVSDGCSVHLTGVDPRDAEKAREYAGEHPLFPADQLDAALDALRTPEEAEVFGAVEVLIPEAMTLRTNDVNAASAALRALRSDTRDLHQCPAAFMLAYAGLRDILAGWDRQAPLGDDFIDAAREYLAAAPPAETRSGRHIGHVELERAIARLAGDDPGAEMRP